MFKDYFGEIHDGRLKTGRFIILWLILMAVFVCFGIAVGVSIGVAEHLVGGDLASAQKLLRETLALPAVIAVAIFFLLFLFTKLNIIAKRARDIGLPGWLSAVIIAGLVGMTSQTTGYATAGGGIGMLLLLVLAFVPSDTLPRAK